MTRGVPPHRLPAADRMPMSAVVSPAYPITTARDALLTVPWAAKPTPSGREHRQVAAPRTNRMATAAYRTAGVSA